MTGIEPVTPTMSTFGSYISRVFRSILTTDKYLICNVSIAFLISPAFPQMGSTFSILPAICLLGVGGMATDG